MTINGVNVSTYHAYQHSVEFAYNKVKQDSEWIRSAALPHFGSSYMDFKKFKVTLMVKGSSRDDIHSYISQIIGLFIGPVTLVLDNFSQSNACGLYGSGTVNEALPQADPDAYRIRVRHGS